MKKAVVLLFSVFLLIIQLSITPAFKIGWNNYQLGLVGVICVALLFDLRFSFINAFLCGVILDASCSLYYGVYTVSFMLIVGIVALSAQFFLKKNILSALILTLLITALFELCMYWIFFLPRGMVNNALVVSKIMLPQALINTGCTVIVFNLYRLLLKWTGSNGKGWHRDKL